MKKRIFTRLACLVLAVVMMASFIPVVAIASAATEAPRYAPVNTRDEKIDEILRIINRYSPTVQYLLEFEVENNTFRRSPQDILDRATGIGLHRNIGDIFGSLGIAAHYRAHHFQSGPHRAQRITIDGVRHNIQYHLINGAELRFYFPVEGVIRTEEATGALPEHLRTVRWIRYAAPGVRPNANTYGAFGLLRELEAYYVDTLVLYETAPYLVEYLSRNGYSNALVAGWFNSWRNGTEAFYEFTFWTLEYMLYLQANHPAHYRAVMDNANFRQAFSYVYRSALRLNEVLRPQIQETVTARLAELGVSGYSSDLSPNAAMLREHLSAPRFVNMLNALLVDGALHPPIIGDPPIPPTETPSSWATDSYERAGDLGILPDYFRSGFGAATTRAGFAELAVVLYEHVRGPITGRSTFNDTNNSFVERAAYVGIVHGVGDGRFNPSAALTRQEAAVMIARLANALGQPLPNSPSTFADNHQVASWAIVAVGQMQTTGIMGGVGNNQFAPGNSYTREQSVVTIVRLLDILD